MRRLASSLAVLTALATVSLVSACDKVPLLAPTGSVITIFATQPTVASNGEVEIVATVIEKGTASTGTGTGTTTTPAAGTPVHNGTVVSFVTNIGRVEPREARTVNGEVRVKYIADGANGAAKITAYSGGATTTLTPDLLVGSAGAERVALSATIQTLPANGGSTEVQARVETAGGSPVPGAPVTFTTTAGTVSPNTTVTDETGTARTTLTANAAATVTATSGGKSSTINVGIGTRSGLNVTANPQTTSAGTPVIFTISTTSGQAVTNAVINYGDGGTRNLGTISGTRTDPHTYTRAGNFPVTVTADNGENAGTAVSVGSLPITVTGAPSPTLLGNPTTFTVNGVTGVQVQRYVFTYDDGAVHETTGPSDSHVFSSRGTHSVRVDVFGVGNVQIGTAPASIVIQ
jgi:hypothetical protein